VLASLGSRSRSILATLPLADSIRADLAQVLEVPGGSMMGEDSDQDY
jgi:hypothetical protein